MAATLEDWRVLGEICLVKRRPKQEATTGGIILPVRSREENIIAEVIAIGDGCAGRFGIGDTVLIGPDDEATIYSEDLEINGEVYMFIKAANIIAKVENAGSGCRIPRIPKGGRWQ